MSWNIEEGVVYMRYEFSQPRRGKTSIQALLYVNKHMKNVRCCLLREFRKMSYTGRPQVEHRRFLLYIGPVVLRDALPAENHLNFLHFSVLFSEKWRHHCLNDIQKQHEFMVNEFTVTREPY